MDTLPVPPFENETKRASIVTKPTSASSAKQIQLTTLESGTSVAPRQRPKGSIQPSSHNLPIVAPPSPSPRNTLSSPIPTAQGVTTNTTAVTASVQQSNQTSADATPQPFQNTATEEPFAAQFQANFPPVQAPVAVTPQYSTANSSQSNSATNVNQTVDDAIATDPNNLDSLFESKFPDPFREPELPTTPSTHSSNTGSSGALGTGDVTKTSTTALATQQQHDVVMPLEMAATPTKMNIQQLLGAPKAPVAGHRRNVSDTSAFNK